jgi:hypothetical protein
MTVADDYFARVRPLLGTGLAGHAVEIDDGELALHAVEMLAGCMLQDLRVTRPETVAPLVDHLVWKQPFQPLRFGDRSDATIATRRGAETSLAWSPAHVTMTLDPTDPLGRLDASYHVARTIRDALLLGTPWPAGTQWYGRAAWPFSGSATPVASAPDYAALAGRHIMVIGCGSVGSEAMRALAGCGVRWTVIDDATVTVFNLARQWYGAEEVGRPKVLALQQRLGASCVRAWRTQLEAGDLPALETLLRADPPDVVMLATGTHHHAMIGQLLWRLGIPHVSAHCYPQARFFEVSIVSPRERTPCLHCFRGHLDRGAPEPAPITDEVARFLYRPISDRERARLYTDLVAEPATRIETMRAAAILARASLELCASRRSAWFERVLAAGTTCLLGGNVARRLADGSFAYGIREPGQVIRLGLEDLTGSVDCEVCKRRVTVAQLPPVNADADPDAALM